MKRRILINLLLLTIFCAVTASAQDGKKNAYGILLDNTGTMRTQMDNVKIIGREIVKQVNQRGAVSLLNFETVEFTTKKSERIKIAQVATGIEWTQEDKPLNQFIDNLLTVAGLTTLVDAIQASAEKVNSKVDSEKGKFSEKVLFLITDGEDRDSKTKPDELIKFLKENKIKVHAVGLLEGFGKDSDYLFPSKNPKDGAKKFLEKITKETGGRVVFPKAKQTVEDIVKNLLTGNIKESK
ncbi:MAG: VWA domain-containing protein [Pyrinomonadaceae bacterium]|nr:VWA domain-containing protein [Pyrinomonadaceae bacterium]